MKKLLHLILLILVCFSLASCGGFFEEETKEILEITSFVDQSGTTVLRIIYSDDTTDEFKIPKGDDGNGIKDIKTEKNDKGNITKITVTYTDETMEPVTFNVADGRSIKSIESVFNEEKQRHYLKVTYNDNSVDTFELPKGDDGNGITNCVVVKNEDGSQTITFNFSQSESVKFTIPAGEKGDSGRGIVNIESKEENGKYILTIFYSDETTQEVSFDIPKPNGWLSGNSSPTPNLGKNGDYYFDVRNKIIYMKELGEWLKVVSFGVSDEKFEIEFNLNDTNDGGPEAIMPQGTPLDLKYDVIKNTYFSQNYPYVDIPIPTREGYKFLGWYKTTIPNPTNAPFTDMTPILSSMTLYACWEKIETNK